MLKINERLEINFAKGLMEEAEGEKSVDKYDSDDDKRLIESLELHIGSLTPNGKGERLPFATWGSPSVDASGEPESSIWTKAVKTWIKALLVIVV